MKVTLLLIALVSSFAFGKTKGEAIAMYNGSCTSDEWLVRGAAELHPESAVNYFERILTGNILNNWFNGRSLVSVQKISENSCIYFFSSLGNEPGEMNIDQLKEEKSKVIKEVIAGKHLVKWVEHKCVDQYGLKSEYKSLLDVVGTGYRLVSAMGTRNDICTYVFVRNLSVASKVQ